jgi:hypothetical protein
MMSDALTVAVVVMIGSFTAVVPGSPPDSSRRFEDTTRGARDFSAWVLKSYRSPQDLNVCFVEGEERQELPLVYEAAREGKLFPARRIRGDIQVGYTAYASSSRISRGFGAERVTLEVASRYCSGERP